MNRVGCAALLAIGLVLPLTAEAEDLSLAYVPQMDGMSSGFAGAPGGGTAAIVGSLERLASAIPAPTGPGNLALALQDGVMNGAEINQFGARNMAAVLQSGAGNQASVQQSGIGHQGMVVQQGRNNVAIIHQR
jgi:hypothetical protein